MDEETGVENGEIESSESSNRPFSAARPSRDRERMGEGERRAESAETFSGLSDGAGFLEL